MDPDRQIEESHQRGHRGSTRTDQNEFCDVPVICGNHGLLMPSCFSRCSSGPPPPSPRVSHVGPEGNIVEKTQSQEDKDDSQESGKDTPQSELKHRFSQDDTIQSSEKAEPQEETVQSSKQELGNQYSHTYSRNEPSGDFRIIVDQLLDLQESTRLFKNDIMQILLSIENVCIKNRQDIQDLKDTWNKFRRSKQLIRAPRKVKIFQRSSSSSQHNTTDKFKCNIEAKKEDSRSQGAYCFQDGWQHGNAEASNLSSAKKTDDTSIGKQVKQSQKRVSKPTNQKHNIGHDLGKKESECTGLSLLDEVTVEYIQKSNADKLLANIEGINLSCKDLTPLVVPDQAPPEAKWLEGQAIDAYTTLISDRQSRKARKHGTALLEKEVNCQIWKTNFLSKGKDRMKYRRSPQTEAGRYLQHDMVFLPLNRNKNHWYVAVLNVKETKIQILDSMAMQKELYAKEENLTSVEPVNIFRRKVAAEIINSSLNTVLEVQEDVRRIHSEATNRALSTDTKAP
ncbi:hypothetical protein EJB05_12318 [Eragrostis curvula]|uniref:Ubiquitin-like protease family profile domain-containing protein n=1 Tax=Eragrostis curvula TaxID=38414 RepID=A0A5J9VTI0_9POAL|nr:hypothetical protein EJB05_12318 [Eragrostis curvula]